MLFLFFYPSDKKPAKTEEPQVSYANNTVYSSSQSDKDELSEALSKIQAAWDDLNLPVNLRITKSGLNSFEYVVIAKDVVGNITDIWRDLAIKSDLCFCEYYEGDENYADKNNYCKACNYINSVELIDASESETYKIFRYLFKFWDYQYLIFVKNNDSRWEFLGNIDLDGQKYGAPKNRIVRKRNGTWLVIDALDGSGTGIVNYSQRWYWLGENKKDGVVESLSYPLEGHLVGWGLPFNREYFSKELLSGNDDLKIAFYAFYTNSRKDNVKDLNELFFVQKDAVYEWDAGSRHFILDQEKSQITQAQIEGIYSDGNDGFLEHNFHELQKLADSKNSANRKWLKIFLGETEDGPKKIELLRKIGVED